jgi:hypothetical protein
VVVTNFGVRNVITRNGVATPLAALVIGGNRCSVPYAITVVARRDGTSIRIIAICCCVSGVTFRRWIDSRTISR